MGPATRRLKSRRIGSAWVIYANEGIEPGASTGTLGTARRIAGTTAGGGATGDGGIVGTDDGPRPNHARSKSMPKSRSSRMDSSKAKAERALAVMKKKIGALLGI